MDNNNYNRHLFKKNVNKEKKRCEISHFGYPAAEDAHIIPMKTLSLLGFEEESIDGCNSLTLTQSLHITYELENMKPSWTLERLGEINQPFTKYKIKLLNDDLYSLEKKYIDNIYDLPYQCVGYLDLHYHICCYLYQIPTNRNISLFDKDIKMSTILQRYKSNYDITGLKRKSEKMILKKNNKRVKLDSSISIENNDEFYSALELLDMRRNKGKTEYLVKWDGFDNHGNPWKDTWVIKSNITSDLIKNFENSI
jgi:hypothetical protein